MRTSELKVGELYELQGQQGPCKYLAFEPQLNQSSPLRFASQAGEERRARIQYVLRTWEEREELDREAVAAIEARQENFEAIREWFADFKITGVRRRMDQPLGEREVRIETADDRLRCVLELSWDTFMDVVDVIQRHSGKAAATEEAAKVKVEA